MEDVIELVKLWVPEHAQVETHTDHLGTSAVMVRATWKYGLMFQTDSNLIEDLRAQNDPKVELRRHVRTQIRSGSQGAALAMAQHIARLLGDGK